jgi:hypothetical protein
MFSPGEYFASMASRPQWVPVFAVSGAALLLVTWGMIPFVLQGLQAAMPDNIPHEKIAGLMEQISRGQYIGLFFSPVILLGKIAIGGVFLTIITQIVLGKGSIRELFSLVAHLLPFSVLQLIQTLVVLKIRGIDAIQSATDVQVSLGLNLLIRDASPAIDPLLQNINLYEIVAFSYLVIGIRRFFKCRRPAAVFISAVYWATGTAVAMALAVIAHDLQR